MQRNRPTLGCLTHFKGGFIETWRGVMAAAQARDANLITFGMVKAWEANELNQMVHNLALWQQVNADNLDGLVSPYLARILQPQAFYPSVPDAWLQVRENLEAARQSPWVQLIERHESVDVPTVEADMAPGTRAITSHLIETHGYQRIAFINGPDVPSNRERYRGYCEALAAHGLSLDPQLVTPPRDWEPDTGKEGIRLLVDQRGTRFDAVVAACDLIALGAIEALNAHGWRVPYEIAVTGIDNDPGLNFQSTCPLTTLYQPFYEIGQRGAELALDHLRGKRIPGGVEHFPAERVVIRRSCGCVSPATQQAALTVEPKKSGTRKHSATVTDVPSGLEMLWEALQSQIQHPKRLIFLSVLEQLLYQTDRNGGDLSLWQNALSALRRQALAHFAADPAAARHAENLCHQARAFLADVVAHDHGRHAWHIVRQWETLTSILQKLSTTFNLEDLLGIFTDHYARLGIPGCYVVLHEQPAWPPEHARLVLACNENGRLGLGPDGLRFPARQILPEGILPSNRRFNLLALPLYFQDEAIGSILFEVGPLDVQVYVALAGALSSALKGVQLYAEAADGRKLAEEANRLKSHFLSIVSHELRTPLSLIVGMSEMMLNDPHASSEPPLPAAYRERLAQINANAQQLGWLIRDVLDLASSQAGQLKLMGQTLDLAETLDLIVSTGEQMAQSKGLIWEADIPPDLPPVWGDAARLRQVGLNLVSNAVKFTAHGKISLRVVREWASVKISVSDTGLGIPLAEQDLIFDEFRQSRRSAARGYGGMGLGLAVTKRLVELHGGEIGVVSSGQENAGSTFFFRLPALTELPDLTAAASQTVLVIAKHAERGQLLQDYLRGRGYETEIRIPQDDNWAADLLAAPPGAVVMDAPLAAELGWKTLKMLKDHPATRSMPVLFYSLASMIELDYLSKPVRSVDLVRALEKLGLPVGETGHSFKSILIVDDEPGLLEFHSHIVEQNLPDCQVRQARNGREALKEMDRQRPDLVLLDLVMPELDGFGVLEAMQASATLRDIPVMVLTAQTLTAADMARFSRGVAAVLEKELFSAEETLAHVEKALSRSKTLGSEGQRWVRKAMAYIHEHYADPISREEIARHVGVGERQLDRHFQQELKLTPMNYLNRCRVRRAKALLETGDRSITEVALAVGFSGSSYFGEIFRREVGVSPSAYQAGERF